MGSVSIIDGNSWGHAFNNSKPLSVGTLQTQAIFGFLHAIRDLKINYPEDRIVVLWDGRAEWRFKLEPEYKSKRVAETEADKRARESYNEQVGFIRSFLCHLNILQLLAPQMEADDLAGYLVSSLPTGTNIRLHTGDKDWLQLMRPNLTWEDRRDDSRKVSLKNFQAYTGYATPIQFLEAKCLTGDQSDCIPGVGGVGPKRAGQFLAEWKSIKAFWRACDEGTFVPKLAWEIRLASPEGRAAFVKNLRLMQLLKIPKPQSLDKTSGKLDVEAFLALCEDLNFNSILARKESYLRPFLSK